MWNAVDLTIDALVCLRREIITILQLINICYVIRNLTYIAVYTHMTHRNTSLIQILLATKQLLVSLFSDLTFHLFYFVLFQKLMTASFYFIASFLHCMYFVAVLY